MLWRKKEDKNLLPDLPPYKGPALVRSEANAVSLNNDELGEEYNEEKQQLPSFPDSMSDKGFSQAAIKDAVGSDFGDSSVAEPSGYPSAEVSSFERISPEGNNRFQTVEMEEWTPSMKNDEVQAISAVSRENSMPRAVPRAPSVSVPPVVSSGRLEEPPTALSYDTREEPIMRTGKNSDIFVKLDKFYSARKALVDAQQKLGEIDALLRKIRETKLREEQELTAWDKELLDIKTKINDIALNLFEKVD